MPTPFESAQLILRLYELRRDETLRKARDFFTFFDPQSPQEFIGGMMGSDGAYVRMVISYWDMAASFVKSGAIDMNMFVEASGEFIFVFGKMEPLLPGIREAFGHPGFLANLEWLALNMPNGRQRVDDTVTRMRAMLAARAAQTA